MSHPPHRLRSAYLLAVCATALQALAAEPAATDNSTSAAAADTAVAPAKPEDKISVSGRQVTDNDLRRGSTATKIIIGREEIARFGDSNIGDVLKRLPGVTVGGPPGRRGGQISMRGMGNYTQILINGEPAARGFSLDSLSPELIERIEVIRAPMAEHSAQAVAGTINIVLREDAKKRTTDLSLAESVTDNHKLQPRISLQHSDRSGQLSYTLAGSIQHYDQLESSSHSRQQLFDANDQLISDQISDSQRHSRGYSLNMAPRLSWRYGEGDTLSLQLFALHSQDADFGRTVLQQPVGQSPYDLALARSDSRFDMLRAFGNRQMPLADGGKFNQRFGFNLNQSSNDENRVESKAGKPDRLLTDDASTRDRGITSGGKWTLPYGEGHSLGLGYDIDWSRRTEDRLQLGFTDSSELDPASNSSATTLRLAGFAQDEWEINPQWSVYGGLRWEQIGIKSTGQGADLDSRNAVWSPSLQGVWRLPDSKADQVRMSLARSYKAPRTADLLARTVQSSTNDEFHPDVTGNPNLRPELAWGLEVGYEHYLKQGGLISANLFSRRIDSVIRRVKLEGEDGRWLSKPINLDHANAVGIELEAKFRLAELMEDAPPMDIRGNFSRYWSNVSGVPGPDNRLDGQAKYSLNLGLDYRFKAAPLTVGGNLSWVPGYTVQISEQEQRDTGGKRVGDVYALWKFGPAAQLRLTAGNLAHADFVTGSSSEYNGRRAISETSARTWSNYAATLELKF